MRRGLILISLTFWLGFTQAAVTLQVDAQKVQMGQPFRLTLTLDDESGLPDLTPLRKNFTIVGTERSINYTVINGQARSVNQWIILLMPKRTGMLTIPSIRVGQEQTTATTVDVTEDKPDETQSMDEPKDIMLLTEVSDEHPYVNQQVIYTVKLYYNRRLLDADYQTPEISDGLLVPLGEGRRYQKSINGIAYAVEEQQYALFPQKSGPLKIKPPVYNALVADVIPRRASVKAKATTLMVKPAPANAGTDWFPAKQVQLTETYDQPSLTLKQGDTLTRTITVQATGAAAQLMPRLNVQKSDQYSIYPEKPLEKTTLQAENLVGTTTVKVTYLLNKSGKIVIPELKLPWFNTVTRRAAVATLPARTLDVASFGGNANAVPAASSVLPKTSTAPVLTNPVNASNPKQAQNNSLAWIIAALFALAWGITLLLWWVKQRQPSGRGRLLASRNKLRDACLANDPQAAKNALLDWAHLQWPNETILTINDVARLVRDPGLKRQLMLLSEVLYQPGAHPWKGETLWRGMMTMKNNQGTPKKPNPLPPINPS
ncbi:protein BatD [Legionella sp. MW5194]|uniref:BatD family protein n=1 Tax=Legionella sp. MW5194 TaxID=2662448 RepID=UPI00193E8822|nr:BatD family protein [Legionella sp. MW5194]QRN02611.1 protein BatD [Legionella sp. MW5194]